MGADSEINKPIIFFDGVCNFCNSSVQFIIKRDSSDVFRFASLQSNAAKKLLSVELINQDNLQSLVMLDSQKIKTKSTAALNIIRNLNGLWPLLYVFILVPTFIRDACYDFIARNRYKWFGKKDQCMIPSSEQKEKFLD